MRRISRAMAERGTTRARLKKLRTQKAALTPAEDIERRRLIKSETVVSKEILGLWEGLRHSMNRDHAQRERILRMFGMESTTNGNPANP